MGINRYTNLSPSVYTPFSMQEILATPLAMRKKNDDLLEKTDLISSGLAKVDPHDKYFEEAIKLKNDLNSKIQNAIKKLNSEGFNNNTNNEIINLNKEYNDLISPTGKIGQINSHKKQVAETIKEYQDSAIKNKWSKAETEKYINEALKNHMSEKPWDEKGSIAKFKINKEAPLRYDYYKEFDDLAKSAGMNTKEFAKATSQLLGPDASGYNAQQSKSYAFKHGKNSEQLQKALDTFVNRLNNPDDAMYKSMDYEGLNKQKLLETLGIQKDVYKKDNISSELSNKIDHFGSGPDNSSEKDGSQPTAITDPSSTKTIGGENDKLDFSSIGKASNLGTVGSPLLMGSPNSGGTAPTLGKKYTYKDVISNPLIRQMYENLYNKFVKENKIHKSRSINDPIVAKTIENYMKNVMPSPTISNKIIRADINPSSDMFMGQLVNKDAASRNNTLELDLNAGLRTIINPENNKPMTAQEFRDKKWKIEYIGYDSPLNFNGYNFKDPKQQVMAHKVIVKDEDNKVIGTSAVSRSHEEKNTPEFKASSLLTFSYRNAVLNSGEWTPIGTKNSPAKNLKGSKIKYNYNGTIDIMTPSGQVEENLPTEALSKYIYNNYND